MREKAGFLRSVFGMFCVMAGFSVFEGGAQEVPSARPITREEVKSKVTGPGSWVSVLSKDRSALTLQVIQEQALASQNAALLPLMKGLESQDPYVQEACMRVLLELHTRCPEVHVTAGEEEAIQSCLTPYRENNYSDEIESLADRLLQTKTAKAPASPLNMDASLKDILQTLGSRRERIAFLFKWLKVYEADALKAIKDLTSVEDLGLAFVSARLMGRKDLEQDLLGALDEAWSGQPKLPQKRSAYGFPGEVGCLPLDPDTAVLCCGDEGGTFHVFLFRKCRVVELDTCGLPAGYIRNSPFVSTDRAFFGGQSRSTGDVPGLYSVSIPSLEVLWVSPIGSIRYAHARGNGKEIFVTSEGTMHFEGGSGVGHGDGGLYCVDRDSGSVLWMLPLPDVEGGDESPSIVKGKLEVLVRDRSRVSMGYELVRWILEPAESGTWNGRKPMDLRISVKPVGGEPRPSFTYKGNRFELREGPDPAYCTGYNLACLDPKTPGKDLWTVDADTFECVSREFEEYERLGRYLFVGSSCIDLEAKE